MKNADYGVGMMIALLVMSLVSSVLAESGHPMRLLVPDKIDPQKLVVTEEGIKFIRNFTGPVSVVTFIGRARSGKSFGLNNLLGIPHSAGFEVGHTFEPQTSGALIWSHAFPGTGDGGDVFPTVLVVDTEGLGASAQLFDKAMIATMSAISSRLIYHTLEYVYTDDVMRLHGLACLVEDYARRGILSDVVLPKITWVVNKCDLKKKIANQDDVTTLFGTILAEIPNPGNNPQISQFNATARVVRTAFSGHVVHLVPSAAPPGVECSALCDLAFDDLASGYTSAIRQLRTEISAEPPRLLPGSESRRMTGRDIADLLETVLPAANEGIERVGDRMADAIVRQHIADTKTRHAAAITNIEYPLETRELDAIVVRMEAAAMSEFRDGPPGKITTGAAPSGPSALAALLVQFEREIEERFSGERLRAMMLNSDSSDKICAEAAERAAEMFSEDRLTKNGSVGLDLDAFDVAVEVARAHYKAAARGPRAEYHSVQLDMRAREARKKVISETAPLRRRAWLGGAILAALVFHMIKQLADLFGWFAPMKLASLLLGGMRNAALIVAIVACLNWAEIDLKYLTFDNVTWALTTIYDGAMKRAPIVIAIIAGGFVSLTALGYCIRGGKQRRR